MKIAQRARHALGRIFYALGLNDPKAWDKSLWNPAGARSLSGEVVTPETALTYSAIWNAVNLISGTISSLPLHIMQSRGEKKLTITNKSLSRVLHSRANRYMTAKSFARF